MSSPTASFRPAPILALTSLRFFAALAVLVLHYSGSVVSGWWAPVKAFAQHGSLGVPLFFVLSGFVLAYNYFPAAEAGRFVPRQYWVARFARIYPVYLFALGLGAIGAVEVHRYSVLSRGFLVAGLTEAGLVQSFILHRPIELNFPGWSLSVEAVFYLLFPLLLGIRRWPRRAAALGCLASAILILACYPPIGQDWLVQTPFLYLPFFLMGMLLARCHQTDAAGRTRVGLAFGTLVCILAVMTRPGEGRWIYSASGVLFGVLVYALAGMRGRNWMSHPKLLLLGEASYGLYILQMPVFAALQHIWTLAWRRHLLPSALTTQTEAFLFLAMAVATGVSLASYHWLEVPMRRYIRQRWSARRVRSVSAAG